MNPHLAGVGFPEFLAGDDLEEAEQLATVRQVREQVVHLEMSRRMRRMRMRMMRMMIMGRRKMVIIVKMKRLINKFRDQVVHLGYNDKGQDEEKNKEMKKEANDETYDNASDREEVDSRTLPTSILALSRKLFIHFVKVFFWMCSRSSCSALRKEKFFLRNQTKFFFEFSLSSQFFLQCLKLFLGNIVMIQS